MNFLIYLLFKVEVVIIELKGLGDVFYYNVIIFGDYSVMSVDIEGVMVVQKNMNVLSYIVVVVVIGVNNLVGVIWIDEGYLLLLLGG